VELPALKRAMDGVAAMVGHAVACIIGGDTLSIIPSMMRTGTDFVICPAETDRAAFMEAMKAYPGVKVRVNLDPEIYVNGPNERIAAEVDSVVALAAGRTNILLGTGAIPYETPVDHVLFMRRYAAS
jgi:uroporphyrinogen-III decarboxylase